MLFILPAYRRNHFIYIASLGIMRERARILRNWLRLVPAEDQRHVLLLLDGALQMTLVHPIYSTRPT